MIKKAVTATFVVLLIITVLYFYKNIIGVLPLLRYPPEDIVKVIEENSTDFPLKISPGFSISIFAKDLPGARVLARDPGGKIIVSLTSEGKVVALPEKIVLLESLNRPHGLAIRCTEKCQLYVAETDKVMVYDYKFDEKDKIHRPVNGKKIIDLPSGGGHFTRTLLFLPPPRDHELLISVGSSCNVCLESDSRRAKVIVADAGGGNLREYASGLRNSVFMAIHSVTGKVWATEMGRDLLGDDFPPDEINIVEQGGNYGWPICYGKNIHDGNFDKNVYIRDPCADKVSSHIDIPAHSALLGLAFVSSNSNWPLEYHNNLIVAYHGSWNRSVPTGYKLVRIKIDKDGHYVDMEDFISGWLTSENKILGRPVDVFIEPNGVMYVTDDRAGVVYKIIYSGK